MYKYKNLSELEKIPYVQIEFMKKSFDLDKHENLAQAIGFDILQDVYVLEDSCSYDAQDYSIAVKTAGADIKNYAHGYTNHHAVIEVHCYGKESLIFVEDPLSVFKLLSELLSEQEIIKINMDNNL